MPDENELMIPGNDELEVSRFKQLANALRSNRLLVHLTTVLHPDGLLDGTSEIGAASPDWPIPSW